MKDFNKFHTMAPLYVSTFHMVNHFMLLVSCNTHSKLTMFSIQDGKKVACGTGDGTINIFSWGEWGDISNRIPTQAASIDVLCALSEGIICTGADDSYIR